MCGILGGNNPEWDYESGIRCMAHRGPDGVKIVKKQDISFAFNRLSIIDLSNAAMQPMISDDGNYMVVFNGEIYGFQELREKLRKKGYHFKTSSDTEVLLNAYIEWKDSFVEFLDGMFAVAFYDRVENKIKLFRDRVGIKPLYYFYDGYYFGFSSELKGIKQMCNNIKLQLDNTALYDYHTYCYIPDPKTMYQKVYKLEAAHELIFDVKSHKIEHDFRYWRLHVNTMEGNSPSESRLEYLEYRLHDILARTIKEQMLADVKVGTFLSGGVDSSIVTAVSHELDPDIETFTIGFSDMFYDESLYAQNMAQQYGINNVLEMFDYEVFDDLFDILPDLYDEPFADNSAYPTYLVSKLARQSVKVVLTGDGGDELFGGYSYRNTYAYGKLTGKRWNKKTISMLYNNVKIATRMKWIGGEALEEDVSRLSELYAQYPDKRMLRRKYSIPSDYDDFWYYRKYYNKELPPITRMRYLDFMTYLKSVLTKVDRASMAVSLEARVPLLAREVIEFAFSLTQEECCPNRGAKGLLKHAYREMVPNEILFREKQGFGIPLSYFNGDGSTMQENIITRLWGI